MGFFIYFSAIILMSLSIGCQSAPSRSVANASDVTSVNGEPTAEGRAATFIATTDVNEASGFRFNRELSINEECRAIYGNNNYNPEGSTPIDMTIYPPKGMHIMIPADDPWAFSTDFDENAEDWHPYQPRPLNRDAVNIGMRYGEIIVEHATLTPGLFMRKTLSVNVQGHYISNVTYELRRGEEGQTFDEMEYQGRLSCVLAGV